MGILATQLSERSINRGIYKALSVVLESKGYYPNRIGKTESQFNTALSALKALGNKIIGVEGVSSGKNKGIDYINRIVITKGMTMLGDYSLSKRFLRPDNNLAQTSKLITIDSSVYDIEYEIRYSAIDVDYENAIREVIFTALGNRNYLTSVNDNLSDGDKFLIVYTGDFDLSDNGYNEKLLRYMVKDVLLVPEVVERADIPKAEITMEINSSDLKQDVTKV